MSVLGTPWTSSIRHPTPGCWMQATGCSRHPRMLDAGYRMLALPQDFPIIPEIDALEVHLQLLRVRAVDHRRLLRDQPLVDEIHEGHVEVLHPLLLRPADQVRQLLVLGVDDELLRRRVVEEDL